METGAVTPVPEAMVERPAFTFSRAPITLSAPLLKLKEAPAAVLTITRLPGATVRVPVTAA